METARLTKCELEIMDVLWTRGEATVQDVCDALPRDLAYTTVMTTLSLLESKKKVLERVKRGRAYVYRPIISRDRVSQSVLAEMREVLFGGSTTSLILNLLSHEKLSAKDVSALKSALAKVEKSS